jgi:hypothetical protein
LKKLQARFAKVGRLLDGGKREGIFGDHVSPPCASRLIQAQCKSSAKRVRPRTSAWGQKRYFERAQTASGSSPIADIFKLRQHVSNVPCADINKRAQQFSKQSAKMTPNPSETKGRGTIPPECSNLCRRASAALGGRCTRGPALSNLGEGLDLHQKVRASQSRHGDRRTLR